jgi:predicted DNA-binding transcriptional regulator AlpA
MGNGAGKTGKPQQLKRLISRKQAREICGLSERSQTRIEDFPKAVEISAGRVALVEDEVRQWVEKRIAERDARG